MWISPIEGMNVSEIGPRCYVYYTSEIYHNLVIYSHVDEYLGRIQCLFIMNKAAMNMPTEIFFQENVPLSLVNTYEHPYHFIKITEKTNTKTNYISHTMQSSNT